MRFFSGVLRKQLFDLPLGDAADFDAFDAASLAAQESNSGFRCFQKLREEIDKGLVGAVFQGRSLQANSDGSGKFAGDFVAGGAGLDAHVENDRSGSTILRYFQHRRIVKGTVTLRSKGRDGSVLLLGIITKLHRQSRPR